MSRKDIEALKKKGVDVTEHPKLVHGQMATPELIETIENLGKAQAEANERRHKALLGAVDKLTKAISDKKIESGLDLAPLVAAVAGLKQEVNIVNEPVDYHLTFERNQRNLIDGEKGLMFTAKPRTVN